MGLDATLFGDFVNVMRCIVALFDDAMWFIVALCGNTMSFIVALCGNTMSFIVALCGNAMSFIVALFGNVIWRISCILSSQDILQCIIMQCRPAHFSSFFQKNKSTNFNVYSQGATMTRSRTLFLKLRLFHKLAVNYAAGGWKVCRIYAI
jgi:hypothetical protein